MSWYVAKVIFRIVNNDDHNQSQFDEQLRLVSAPTRSLAFEKAVTIGKRCEDRFFNDKRQAVKWQFINVAEVNELSSLEDGTELHYNIHEAADANLYMAWANHRASLIELDN